MCGKTTQSSNAVQIPADVLARYNSVNTTAQTAASQPFQKYSDDPNAFVAPVNATQQGGIGTVTNAAGAYQPYYSNAGAALAGGLGAANTQQYGALSGINAAQQQGQDYLGASTGLTNNTLGTAGGYNNAATGLAMQGGQAVDPSQLNAGAINQYMSPYLNDVVGSTLANLQQQQQMDQSSLVGNQIGAGAFGGDRGKIAQANLAKQQEMGTAQTVSGLLNQGYGQALQTAEGQQQLGLGAAQANRAATQNEATQIAGIGQQGFSQGLSGAQQLASLGNQGFTQGLGAAQAQAGIGNTLFDQGNTIASQQLAMGNGAQSNQLAQGQAQIAAGGVQQQTDQAGKTALYNQFQQQQSYPFQTSQFLANIAEGTGSLSGNTTTGTQQGSFFSDERLKDDMEVIGKTFDGQKIVKFRYKGSPQKHIGLVAQDVEKHHPGAVGLAAGYKTVNYDDATKDAAEKGHFKRGGLVLDMKRYANGGYADGGLSMYPYQSDDAGRTGGGSGPRGIGLVPLSHLQLIQPNPVKSKEGSGLHDLANTSNDVSSLIDKGTDAYDWYKDESADTPEPAPVNDKRGGLVGGYADGGAPYTDRGGEGYVPDNSDNVAPATKAKDSNDGGGGKSGGGLGDIVNLVKGVASVAAMFNRGGLAGGRHGYATDGGVTDIDDEMSDDPALREAAVHRKVMADAAQDAQPSRGLVPPEAPPVAPIDKNYRQVNDVNIPQSAIYPADNDRDEPPSGGLVPRAANTNAPSDNKGNWFDRNREWLIPAVKGIGTAAASKNRYALGALLEGAGAAAGSYGDIEKQQAEIANIKANKPMIEANVVGKSIANTGAQIANSRNSLYTSPFGNFVFVGKGVPMPFGDYQKMLEQGNAPPLMGSVPADADVRVTSLIKGLTGSHEPVAGAGDSATAPNTSGAAPVAAPSPIQQPPKPKYLPSGVAYDDQSRASADEERKLAYNGGQGFANAKNTSETYRNNVVNESNVARQNSIYLKELASTVADSNKLGGFEVAGTGDKFRSEVVRVANTLSRGMGGEDIGSADALQDKLGKLTTMLGQQGAQAGNQESYAALDMLKGANPNLKMSPDAAADLAAGLMVMNRRAIDREEHMGAYAKDSNGLMAHASDDFERKNNNAQYERDRQILSQLILRQPDEFKMAMSGKLSRAELTRAAQQFFPNSRQASSAFVRYFSPRD